MQQRIKRSTLSLAVLAGLLGGGWSSTSYACATEPYTSSICIMAWNRVSNSFGNGTFLPANGALMQINTNMALYSLIGTTYGGNGSTNFQLPDLRGKVVVGTGQNPDSGLIYNVGQKGGAASVTLTTTQMPTHSHMLVTGTGGVTTTTTLGNMAAATSLSGLSASTSLSSVTASAAGSGLTLNGSTGGNFGTNPASASLGTYSGTIKVYSDATPSVAMKSGSISGSAPVTFSGNPTTTISGTAATTLSGTPGVTIGGMTSPTGSGQPVNTMSPYLAMGYYIAALGVYPTPD